jgi:hypothetical protein
MKEAKTMSTITEVETTPQAIEELADRIFLEGAGALHLGSVYIGVKHGLFAALAEDAPLNAHELAARTGLDGWYVREWLQAEATAGLLLADDDDVATASFTAAPGVRETLVEETNAAFIGGMPLAAAAAYSVMPELLKAFRSGAGVPYASYGEDAVEAQAALNRPAFVNELVAEWIPQVPDIAALLADSSRVTRVADVGCGLGWASIELAKAYPQAWFVICNRGARKGVRTWRDTPFCATRDRPRHVRTPSPARHRPVRSAVPGVRRLEAG